VSILKLVCKWCKNVLFVCFNKSQIYGYDVRVLINAFINKKHNPITYNDILIDIMVVAGGINLYV
jgi:hypothetical protein